MPGAAFCGTLTPMPLPAVIAVVIAFIGGALLVGNQIRISRRERRNLQAWERGEDFKSTSGWD